jgi:hypothetical protein
VQQRNEPEVAVQPDGIGPAENPEPSVVASDSDDGRAAQQEEDEAARVPDGSAADPVLIDDDMVVKQDEDNASATNGGGDEVYYTLARREVDSDGTEVLGFITARSREATFSDLRVLIEHELNQLPGHNAWDFYFPSLGPVNTIQETSLGSVADRLERVNDPSLGDGTFGNPFRLSILL